MKEKLRKRIVCFLLVFCCLFSLATFPASADSGILSGEEMPAFTDLPESWWSSKEGFLPFEAAAVKYGLIRGYPDNTFHPEAFLKQGDAVLMLYRLHKKLKGEVSFADNTEEFPEAAGYQREALRWAKREGLVKDAEPFEPQKEILLDGLMVLFYRYLQILGEEGQYGEGPAYTANGEAGVYSFSISTAGIPFVRLWETLSYRAEESTPRLKFAVEREYPGERWEKSTQNYDMEEPRFLSTIEEYEKYRYSLQMGFPRKDPQPGEPEYGRADVTRVRQPKEPEITKEFFQENRLVVVEKWSKDFFLWDRELSDVQIEGEKVKLSFVPTYEEYSGPDMDGLVFLVAVPKSVTSVDCETLYWTGSESLVEFS